MHDPGFTNAAVVSQYYYLFFAMVKVPKEWATNVVRDFSTELPCYFYRARTPRQIALVD